MTETDCDILLYCPTMGNELWMFDPRLLDIVNRFAHFTHLGALRIFSRRTLIIWAGQVKIEGPWFSLQIYEWYLLILLLLLLLLLLLFVLLFYFIFIIVVVVVFVIFVIYINDNNSNNNNSNNNNLNKYLRSKCTDVTCPTMLNKCYVLVVSYVYSYFT